MELLLNLAWLLIAGAIVFQWIRGGSSQKTHRLAQLIALLMVIAILFPVISVSDDLLAGQNAVEASNFQRRDHLIPSNAHPIQPVLAFFASVLASGNGLGFLGSIAPARLSASKADPLESVFIFNRPPPAA